MKNSLNIFIKYIRNGILYYWYTGDKKIALAGGLTGSLINIVSLTLVSGGSGAILALMLLMDHLLIILVTIYIIAIRNITWFDTVNDKLDDLFVKNFIYLIIGWIINRVITNLIAEKIFKKELFGYKKE